jgi:hypothetical protein
MINDKDSDLNNPLFASKNLAKNNRIESFNDFRKNDIELAFVDVDEQLKQLAFNDEYMSRVRRIAIIQQIRNRLFELYNEWLYGLNVREFASHEPGDKTPLNNSTRC